MDMNTNVSTNVNDEVKQMKSNEILDTYKKIIFDSKKMTKLELEKKYEKFIELYEPLFKRASTLSPDLYDDDIKTLKMMLKTKDDKDNGVIDKFHSDVYIGNTLGNKYVYKPILGRTLTKDEISDAINKLKKSME